MHILFAGGGTAGHINPALAVAGYIKEKMPDAKISYIGKKNGLEQTLVPKAGYDFYPIEVEGFQRSLTLKNIKRNIVAVKKVFSASSKAKKLLKELNPDIVMGTGGYVSGPVLRQAAKLKIKTLIHEQNAFPGVTTKMLVNDVDRVMLAFADAKERINMNKEPVITGNPVRQNLIKSDASVSKQKIGVTNKPIVLSFGGSLGAGPINKAICGFIANTYKSGKYHYIHATGKNGYDEFVNDLKSNGVDINAANLDIRPYIDDMDICMSAADLVICRAGAITLCELQALGKPSVLIPSPYVAENHQYFNAMTLVNAGAAHIIEEKDLSVQSLTNTVCKLLDDTNELTNMSSAALKSAIIDANERIFNTIKSLLNEN